MRNLLSAGASLNEPPELQQLALNFLATFLATFFSRHLTEQTTTVIHLHVPRKFFAYVTWGLWAYVSLPDRRMGYGGLSTGSESTEIPVDALWHFQTILTDNVVCRCNEETGCLRFFDFVALGGVWDAKDGIMTAFWWRWWWWWWWRRRHAAFAGMRWSGVLICSLKHMMNGLT